MNFLNTYWLWALLILLPGVWLLFRLGDRRRKHLLRAWLGGGAKTDLAPGKRALRRWLLAGAILFFVLAAARPWWGEHLLDVPVAGGDVLAVFDVSKSMLAQDVVPSRLEHAKWLLRELIKSNPGDRFGIVAFAGRAFLACPLTSDQVSLDLCIAELEPALVPVGGTNLAEALRTALHALRASSGQRRTILLLTDGEELTGSVSELLAELKKQNVELLVAGFGDPAVPALIPEPGPDGHAFKRDRQGELVRTRLNEELLKKLAAATGGFYCNSTALHSGLEELNRRLRALPDGERHELRRTLPIDRFMGFLILGTILLALWFVLGETQSAVRRRVMLFYLGILGTLWSLPLAAQEETAKVPPEAPVAPELSPAPETPAVKDPVTLYNEARSLQIDGKHAEAHRNYEEALSGGDAGAVREASMHNLGILSHQEARDITAEALRTAQSGDLDAALQALGRAGQSLDKAEAWYLDALAGPDRPELRQTALAQQLLLKDREHLEQLKKQLEELKKKQEEARRKTQQAARQNQQQNQQQQDQQQKQDQQQNQQDQQKQDQQQGQQEQQNQQEQQKQDQQQGQQGQQKQDQQQNQQDQQKQDQQQGQQGQQGQQKQDQQNQQGQQGQQKQDQQKQQEQQKQDQQQGQQGQQKQGQQKQDRKDPARQALDDARDAVDRMRQAADQAGQKQVKEQAEQAQKELDQAADKQRKQDYSGAQKHLDAAQKALGADSSGEKSDKDKGKDAKDAKDGKEGKDKGKDAKDAKDGKEGKETPEDKPEGKEGREGKDKPLPAMPEDGRQEEQKMDQRQADALLDLMSRDEEKLRDELKQHRNRAVRPVEKDW